MRAEDRYISDPDQLRRETFKLKQLTMQREMQTAGVLDVEIDAEYIPVDMDYEHIDNEDLFYDSFINSHTFVTNVLRNDTTYDDFDIFGYIGRRFDYYVDELSKMYGEHGDKQMAHIAQNLTLEGAAANARDRYNHYLGKFIDGTVEDPQKVSQDVTYWSWAHLVLDTASRLPSK